MGRRDGEGEGDDACGCSVGAAVLVGAPAVEEGLCSWHHLGHEPIISEHTPVTAVRGSIFPSLFASRAAFFSLLRFLVPIEPKQHHHLHLTLSFSLFEPFFFSSLSLSLPLSCFLPRTYLHILLSDLLFFFLLFFFDYSACRI